MSATQTMQLTMEQMLAIEPFNRDNLKNGYGPSELKVRQDKSGLSSGSDIPHVFEIIRRFRTIPANGKWLILGGGVGRDTRMILAQFPGSNMTVVEAGLATNVHLATGWEREPRITLVQGSVHDLEFKPNTFDFALALGGFLTEHAPIETQRLFEKMLSTLKPDGVFVGDVADPDGFSGDPNVQGQLGHWEIPNASGGSAIQLKGFLGRPDQYRALAINAGLPDQPNNFIQLPWELVATAPEQGSSGSSNKDPVVTSWRILLAFSKKAFGAG